jgi:hypothetical protein
MGHSDIGLLCIVVGDAALQKDDNKWHVDRDDRNDDNKEEEDCKDDSSKDDVSAWDKKKRESFLEITMRCKSETASTFTFVALSLQLFIKKQQLQAKSMFLGQPQPL